MDKKKKIAIILVAAWIVLIVWRTIFAPEGGTPADTSLKSGAGRIIQAKPEEKGKSVSYPPLRFSLERKDLFAELVSAQAEKKEEAGQKKIVSIPAPPLPLLPEEPKLKKDEKAEDAPDSLKDLVLLGVMDKEEKKLAFLKKGRDIKAVGIGEAVFNSVFFIEKIEANMVTLKNNIGQKRNLEIVKEVKHEKK